jgi:hypothetical protein
MSSCGFSSLHVHRAVRYCHLLDLSAGLGRYDDECTEPASKFERVTAALTAAGFRLSRDHVLSQPVLKPASSRPVNAFDSCLYQLGIIDEFANAPA